MLITGASAGFGAAAALAFAREGANLLLGARRTDRLEALAKECHTHGGSSAHAHFLDVSKSESVDDFARWAGSVTRRIDVLINNAGGAHGVDPVEPGRMKTGRRCFRSTSLGCCA